MHFFAPRSAVRPVLVGVIFAAHLSAVPAWAQGKPPPAGDANSSPLTRVEVIREVLEHNPDLFVAKASERAERANVGLRSAWRDPTLSVAFAPATLVTPFFGGAAPGASVRVGQAIAWPMRLDDEVDAARRRADAADATQEALALSLAADASILFDDYWAAAEAIEVQRELVTIARQNELTASAVYKAGTGSQQDPLEAEVERIHAEHQLHVFERQLATTRTRLLRLMHRPPHSPLPRPAAEPMPTKTEPVATIRSDGTAAPHPRIEAQSAMADAARSTFAATDWRFLPDVEAFATYNSMWPMLSHQFMVGLTVALPVQFGRRQSEVAKAKAQVAVANHALESEKQATQERQQLAEAELDEAVRIEALLRRELLPAADNRASAALAGYQNGENAFGVMVAAERHRFDVRLQLIRAQAAVRQAQARRDEANGRLPFGIAIEDRTRGESRSSLPSLHPTIATIDGGAP